MKNPFHTICHFNQPGPVKIRSHNFQIMTNEQIQIINDILQLIQKLLQTQNQTVVKPEIEVDNPFKSLEQKSRDFIKKLLFKFGTTKTSRHHPFVMQNEREMWVKFSNLMRTLEQRGLVILEWENYKNSERKFIKTFQFTKNFG